MLDLRTERESRGTRLNFGVALLVNQYGMTALVMILLQFPGAFGHVLRNALPADHSGYAIVPNASAPKGLCMGREVLGVRLARRGSHRSAVSRSIFRRLKPLRETERSQADAAHLKGRGALDYAVIPYSMASTPCA